MCVCFFRYTYEYPEPRLHIGWRNWRKCLKVKSVKTLGLVYASMTATALLQDQSELATSATLEVIPWPCRICVLKRQDPSWHQHLCLLWTCSSSTNWGLMLEALHSFVNSEYVVNCIFIESCLLLIISFHHPEQQNGACNDWTLNPQCRSVRPHQRLW